MSQRIKGQEVRLTVVSPDGTEDAVNQGGVKSLNLEFKMDILSEGYLGETTERKDDIFKGVAGRCEFHLDRQSWFRLIEKIKARSQRRTADGVKFQIMVTLSMPNGERPRVLLDDVYFASPKTDVSGRDEYVTAGLDFEASDGRFLF